jgi:hypothetical protein
VNAQLEGMEGPERVQALMGIMRHLTKQTADGSVEMADFAKYVGVIASSAKDYQGDYNKNTGALGALSQMAMKGGAYSAAMATGSAAAFSRDIKKGATLKKWTEAKIDVFADDGKTKLKSPEELILAYIDKKGTNQAELAKFFPNVVSKRAVANSMDVYNAARSEAKGSGYDRHKAGLAAVRAEFAKYSKALDPAMVEKLYAEQDGTTANMAIDFNNKLERIVLGLSDNVLPALERAAPSALMVASTLASAVTYLSDNPGKAMVLAITGSIVKAGLGEVMRSLIARFIAGAAGGAAGAGGGAAGAAGRAAGGGIGTLGIVGGAVTVGAMIGTGLGMYESAQIDEGATTGSSRARGIIGQSTETMASIQAKREAGQEMSLEDVQKLFAQRVAFMEQDFKATAAGDYTGSFAPFKGFLDNLTGKRSYADQFEAQAAALATDRRAKAAGDIDAMAAQMGGSGPPKPAVASSAGDAASSVTTEFAALAKALPEVTTALKTVAGEANKFSLANRASVLGG